MPGSFAVPAAPVEWLSIAALAALIAYAVLAGADFGGGVWDLLATGGRASAQREAIGEAMGPVWEANHVWLIFLVVLVFTGLPFAFYALNVSLYWPFHLVLVGIVLRGAAFVFRAHGREAADSPTAWGRIFGGASFFTPLLLGACLGAVSSGRIRVSGGVVQPGSEWAWVGPFSIATGLLALAICAYLAAVYLTLETEGEVQEDFRRRALWVWLLGGVVSMVTLAMTYLEAPHLWKGLTGEPALPIVIVGMLLAPASAYSMLRRHYLLARICAIGQVVLLLLGWALAQYPYAVYPDVTLEDAAAPTGTIVFVLWTIPFGLVLLLPSLWALYYVFKARNPAV